MNARGKGMRIRPNGRSTHVLGGKGKNIQLRNLDQDKQLIAKKRDEYEYRDRYHDGSNRRKQV